MIDENLASMAEWSKAVDLSSTGRKSAWVQTPLLAFKFLFLYFITAIAQSVERMALNHMVEGSSPSGGVRNIKPILQQSPLHY